MLHFNFQTWMLRLGFYTSLIRITGVALKSTKEVHYTTKGYCALDVLYQLSLIWLKLSFGHHKWILQVYWPSQRTLHMFAWSPYENKGDMGMSYLFTFHIQSLVSIATIHNHYYCPFILPNLLSTYVLVLIGETYCAQ